jgi:hypothetical protein
MSRTVKPGEEKAPRRWESPTLHSAGTLGSVLQGGGGKESISPADPGESRKPKPKLGGDGP